MEGLFGLIHKSTRKYPGRVFIRSTDRIWSYSQVYTMSQIISRHILGCGIKKGDRVVVFCDNSVQYAAAFFGIMRVNAVAVPVNTSKMIESLLYIMEKCSPRLIITCDSSVDKLIRIGDRLDAGILNIDDLNICSTLGFVDGVDAGQLPAVDGCDPAVILFTSGTTAHPKGVTLTHDNLIANTCAIIDYLNLTCDDSVLMTLPFTYSYGNSILLTHAYAGASLVIENSSTYPFKVLEGIKKYGVSGFSTVGSYINLMLKYIKNSDTAVNFFESLRYITFAGESTNIEDIMFIDRNYPDIKIFVMYGQTEASARLSYLSPHLLHEKTGSVGKGLCNVMLKVVDESGNAVKPGEVGEIIAYGPNIMKGYWEDPAATEEVLRDDWLYTGDYATVDEDGYIYIKGRRSDIIKFMGHRISPVEIENVINSCSHVKESAVVEGTLDMMPVIKAFIVLEKECALEEIRKYVNTKLPMYMRPQIFEVVEQLPRTDSGKIRRSVLRSRKCAE